MRHELVPGDHVCRVIDAFVDRLAMAELGFERAKAEAHDEGTWSSQVDSSSSEKLKSKNFLLNLNGIPPLPSQHN